MISASALLICLAASALGAPQLDLGPRVISGEDAGVGELPYIVSLRSASTNSHSCGGSILNANWILTAAHCIVGKSPSSIIVVSGTNTLNSGGNTNSVSKIITHEQYSSGDSWKNDIGLLRLSSPLTINELAQPIKLPKQDQEQGAGLPVIAMGWGYTTYPGWTLPNNLQKLSLNLVSNAECQSAHSGTIHQTSVCASAGKGKGVCNGDSGSPLVEASSGVIAGIVSWGRPCAVGVPDVYTRVAKYIDWINKNAQ